MEQPGHRGTLFLRSERLVLRPQTAEDSVAVREAIRESAAAMRPWLPWVDPGNTGLRRMGFINVQRAGLPPGLPFARREFVIFEGEAPEPLGCVCLTIGAPANRHANLAYWVRTSATRRGVATEAARMVAEYGFRQLGLNRIEIITVPANVASCRVAEKCGAKFEGIARNRIVMHDEVHDAMLFSLVPEDLGIRPPMAPG